MRAASFLSIAVLGFLPTTPQRIAAQDTTAIETTYETERVRELVERGAAARRATGEGIASYEVEIRDRIYVALGGGLFRRERTLFEQARSAQVLWTREGTDLVKWTGAQQRVPIAGMDTSGDEDYLDEFATDLAGGDRPLAMLDPREDILSFGDDDDENEQFILHPLSDTAGLHYQYFAGDTLTLSFVGDEAPVRLAEVRVQPRRVSFQLVAASLWFDLETGQLARASMRPARPFSLRMDVQGDNATIGSADDREDANNIPSFVPDLQFEVRYITVEYSLHERQWWLARRFAFEGEARAGRWLGVPFLIETTLNGYSVNPVEPELTREMMDEEGWRWGFSRRGGGPDEEEPDSVISMVPPLDSLDAAGLLGELDELEMGAVVFDQAEIDRIRRDLESIVGQVPVSYRPSLRYGWDDDLFRFNRVEGLSLGARVSMPVAPLVEGTLTGRLGLADLEPRGELRIERSLDETSAHFAAYRRLADGSDFDDPLDRASSIKALFSGKERGQFYDAYGAEVGLGWNGRSTDLDIRMFIEEHRAVETETSFHLLKPLTDGPTPFLIVAEEGRVGGISTTLSWNRGTDPAGLAAWGKISGEVASGDFDYQRAFATLGTAFPAVASVASALEFGAGTSWNGPPIQRLHYLGGGATLRGLHESELSGATFWYGRGELATAFPAFRLAVFGDAGWAGPKSEFGFDDPWVGVGAGVSLLSGVGRLDVARGVRRGDQWHIYLYLDGIL